MVWLDQASQQYAEYFDVIFIDPPTFSNSKRMENHFDVQADHTELLTKALLLLKPGGRLIFSNNFQKFKLDEAALSKWKIEDISAQTLDKDFQRNKKIHRCWRLTH